MKFNKHAKNCSTTRAKTLNFKSRDWLKVVNVSFITNY